MFLILEKFQNVSNEFKWGSSKGQIPFIELDGVQYADSENIIEVLIQKYSLPIDSGLNPKDLADKRAYRCLLEESLFKGVMYFRHRDINWLFSDDKGAGGNMNGIKKFAATKVGPYMFKKQLERVLHAQGMGRNTVEEVIAIMKKDLLALNALLNGKPYFFGSNPTSVSLNTRSAFHILFLLLFQFDSTAFGILAQLIYTPVDDAILTFITTETPDIKNYVERIKAEYWPEWEEITQGLLMNSKTPEERADEAIVAAKEASKQAADAQIEAAKALESTVIHETALAKNELDNQPS